MFRKTFPPYQPQEDSELDRRRALYGSARMLPLDAGHFDLGMPQKEGIITKTTKREKTTTIDLQEPHIMFNVFVSFRIECLTGITCAWDLTPQIRRHLDVWAAHAGENAAATLPVRSRRSRMDRSCDLQIQSN